jgi:protein involved in polysaccharide export with SLBB domain
LVVASLAAALCSGCAALTNPVARGVPVRNLPTELHAASRDGKETIPLSLLRQRPPDVYRLAPGDVLGVYIEGVLGDRRVAPEVVVPQAGGLPPAIGSPTPVRADGTVSLPLVRPIRLAGLTLIEAEQAVIRAYTVTQAVVQPGQERVIVSLIQPRMTRVTVVRSDNPGSMTMRTTVPVRGTRNLLGATEEVLGGTRRGTATVLDLPAYENDVLNALVRTGGLPGLDAINEVIIERAAGEVAPGAESDANHPRPRVRIPLRLAPCERPPFRPDDVILGPGDIVFIEARDGDVFYAAGLLPAGEYPLPRDHDIDVVEAVAMIGGPMVNGAFGGSNLSGALIQPGTGFPSPSLVSVLRRTDDGRQATIRVDLNRALRDPRESLVVRRGDVLILQETPHEALARYFTDVVTFQFFWEMFRTSRSSGTVTTVVP